MTLPPLLDLTPEQEAAVTLPFDGRHLITGPAGSGKTVAAVYRAWALATVGRPTALVTHSNLLSQHTAHASARLGEGIRVTTFHRWLRTFWNDNFACDPPSDGSGEWSYDWESMRDECLDRPPRRIDDLVIDEGQELPPGFYRLCRFLPNQITVFADESLGIGEEQTGLDAIDRALKTMDGVITLPVNLRTTREIALLANTFHVGPASALGAPPERSGERPVLLQCPHEPAFLAQLAQFITAHQDRTIGIVCRSTQLQREIHRDLALHGLATSVESYVSGDINRSVVDFSSHRVHVIHAASMKGMEFDILFVPDLDAYAEDPSSASTRSQFHVLCTRARDELFLIHYAQHPPEIVDEIAPHLLERRAM
ncbi:AAA family ATPase [Streptomyces sp. NBC_01003]|uniref:AAA family ATPase n=1 Tax=Streptomyces sp. NBC_01003 TaxID=2903714 RepID=UPI00386FC67F|nr:AAA family ATPase [Streptomyces sp. NBC_01003]